MRWEEESLLMVEMGEGDRCWGAGKRCGVGVGVDGERGRKSWV